MTIPTGATHILKEAHVDSVFFDYVKVEGDRHYSFNVNGWFLDNNISRFMGFYEEIVK